MFVIDNLVLLVGCGRPCAFGTRGTIVSVPIIPRIANIIVRIASGGGALVGGNRILFQLSPAHCRTQISQLVTSVIATRRGRQTLNTRLSRVTTGARRTGTAQSGFTGRCRHCTHNDRTGMGPFSRHSVSITQRGCLTRRTSMGSSTTRRGRVRDRLSDLILNRRSRVTDLGTRLTRTGCGLRRAVIHTPDSNCIARILVHPNACTTSLPLHPIVIFVPSRGQRVITRFHRGSLLQLTPNSSTRIIFGTLPNGMFDNGLTTVDPTIPNKTCRSANALRALGATPNSSNIVTAVRLSRRASLDTLPSNVCTRITICSSRFDRISIVHGILLHVAD